MRGQVSTPLQHVFSIRNSFLFIKAETLKMKLNRQSAFVIFCCRVISAIEININQLQGESEIYKAALATKEREIQQRRIKERREITPRSIASNDGEDEIDNEKDIGKECSIIDDDDETASSVFEKELQLLSSAIRVHEQELNMLEGRLTEQCKITQQIAMQEEQLQQELRYFEYYTQHVWTRVQRPVLTNYMKRAQDEFDAISSLQLPSLLFDVFCPLLPKEQDQKVSESSYSKINYLRLSHLPCAKLSLTWDEINAAWSQAAQLIFMVGGEKNQWLSLSISLFAVNDSENYRTVFFFFFSIFLQLLLILCLPICVLFP